MRDDLILVRKSRPLLSLFEGTGSLSSSSLNTLTSSEAESVSSDCCEAFLLLVDALEAIPTPVAIPDPPDWLEEEEAARAEEDVTVAAVDGILFTIHIPNPFTSGMLVQNLAQQGIEY